MKSGHAMTFGAWRFPPRAGPEKGWRSSSDLCGKLAAQAQLKAWSKHEMDVEEGMRPSETLLGISGPETAVMWKVSPSRAPRANLSLSDCVFVRV